jgi:hypothetical protein
VNRRAFVSAALAVGACRPQQDLPEIPWVCPMDPDVRAKGPSKCPKCGMALVAGIPEPREFEVDLQVGRLAAGVPVPMRFRIHDPKTGRTAKLQIIHEKLMHLFLVSADLRYFGHEHPEQRPDGSFTFTATLPQAGEYRVLSDFYPEGATPQMVAKAIIVPGRAPHAELLPDAEPQTGTNVRVRLRSEPLNPLAGTKTMLFFDLDPAEGLEQYLGAWGHMLAASADLVDMMHAHPAWEEVRNGVQFNVIFPRAGMHRIWVQFQRLGVVNTVAFTIPVLAV